MTSATQYSLSQLITGLDAKIQGDATCLIEGVCSIDQSKPGHITFLDNPLYRKYLTTTKAAAVILNETDAADCPINAIVSRQPYFVYAKIAAYFSPKIQMESGIHPSAYIGTNCDINKTAMIGPHVTIGHGVRIGARVRISAGCSISDNVVIGDDTLLDANVSIYDSVRIGSRVHLSSGVVIGADGFGIANHQGAWHKVPQLGSVVIGDDVDIGANTAIDRGAIENTIIENGVKLDNLIQIGHNVKIGAHTVIAGCVGIAGSTQVGKYCMIGGGSCINGHIQICDKAMITGMSAVTKSILEPGVYSSGIVGVVPNKEFRKNNARFHRLDNLMQRVKQLESALKSLSESQSS